MRYGIRFVLVFMLVGCTYAAPDYQKKPSGEEIFDLLIKNSNRQMASEPACDGASATRKKLHVTLGEVLSTNLSVSYDTDNVTTTKSYCNPSKFESGSKVIDVWDCSIEVLESDKKGEFISSSIVTFSTDLEKSTILPGSIRCF